MAKWTIEIVNGGDQARSYALLADSPEVTLEGAPVPVLPAVCASFDYVESGQPRSVTFSEAVQALVDFPTTVEVDRVVIRAFAVPVDPIARDLVTITQMENDGHGVRGFARKTTPGAAEPGCFAIHGQVDFPRETATAMGMAKLINSKAPVPAAVFAGQPHVTYQIRPKPVFHLIEGRYVVGKLLDLAHKAGAIIDFTGRDQAKATVSQAADGRFDVVYDPA
jgi:hypothetical protein